MRLALFQLSESHASCVWTFDRALLDGRSFPIIIKEVFAFYDAFCQGQDLQLEQPRPYRDYIQWQQQQDFSKAQNFRRELLRGFSATTCRRQSSSHKKQPARSRVTECQCLRTARNSPAGSNNFSIAVPSKRTSTDAQHPRTGSLGAASESLQRRDRCRLWCHQILPALNDCRCRINGGTVDQHPAGASQRAGTRCAAALAEKTSGAVGCLARLGAHA